MMGEYKRYSFLFKVIPFTRDWRKCLIFDLWGGPHPYKPSPIIILFHNIYWFTHELKNKIMEKIKSLF